MQGDFPAKPASNQGVIQDDRVSTGVAKVSATRPPYRFTYEWVQL